MVCTINLHRKILQKPLENAGVAFHSSVQQNETVNLLYYNTMYVCIVIPYIDVHVCSYCKASTWGIFCSKHAIVCQWEYWNAACYTMYFRIG